MVMVMPGSGHVVVVLVVLVVGGQWFVVGTMEVMVVWCRGGGREMDTAMLVMMHSCWHRWCWCTVHRHIAELAELVVQQW